MRAQDFAFPAPVSSVSSSASQADRSGPKRVLIIDDDPLTRALLVSTLKDHCVLTVAAEGSEGYAKALEHVPDVAVIDVNMPGWNGLKTLDAFQSHPALKNVKVVMLTADSSKQTVIAATQGGAHDYLIKTSFSKREFYHKLNRLVPGTIPDDTEHSRAFACDAESYPSSPLAAAFLGDGSTTSNTAAIAASSKSSAEQGDAGESQLQSLIDGWE